MMKLRTSAASIAIVALLAVACGAPSENVPIGVAPGAADSGAGDDTAQDSAAPDASVPVEKDAAAPPAKDGSAPLVDAALPPDPTDGTPSPSACASGSNYGTELNIGYGRLDGFLANKRCGGIDTHLHVQVRMNDKQYDVAVNLDTLYAVKDAHMPGAAWSEGWHQGLTIDYAQTFGLHTGDFTQPASMSDLATTIENEIENANHISIYATGYGPTGVHDVHRKPSGTDGVIVIHPLSAAAHMIMFRFANDSF
jgi:hypothetical protein